jgi:PAS domain S-box-containing protein
MNSGMKTSMPGHPEDSRQALVEKRYRAFLKFLPIPLLVQNMDHSVAYLNPAYEKTFGWTRKDLESNPFLPIPEDQISKTRTGKVSLLKNGVFYGLETKRLTKDGRVLDVIYDGAALYDHNDQPNGLISTMRDITQSKKDARITRALFKIAKALHRYNDLKTCLIFIARQAQLLMNVRNAFITLINGRGENIHFRTGVTQDREFFDTFSEGYVSLTDSPIGKIILSGRSYINNEINGEEELEAWKVKASKNRLQNMIAAPMQVDNRIIGAMVMTDRIDGQFDQQDITLLSSVASMVAMPVENARINESLRKSYEDIQTLNQAKDRIIDRLSHELRTPISVLAASFEMLAKKQYLDKETAARLIERCQRNIERIIDMQYKLEDIVSKPDQRVEQSLSAVLALCIEELEALVGMEAGSAIAQRIRKHIDAFFSRRKLPVERIRLHRFVHEKIIELNPLFAHRLIDFRTELGKDVGFVDLPVEILDKIVTGLVRNAIEYTPDGATVKVSVSVGDTGPGLEVSDTGIGITDENQQLIKDNFFTTDDAYQYSTGKPFHFDAGGRGLDLLRMRVFSERYPIKLSLKSKRCRHIPTSADKCPGSTNTCIHCDSAEHCHRSGGSAFSIQFVGADIDHHQS